MPLSLRTEAPDQTAAPLTGHEHDRGGRHWEAWGLRVALAAMLGVQFVGHNASGAVVAGEGLLVLMIPPAISHFSSWHVPRVLELAVVAGMFLQFASESFKHFKLLTYWDKIAHPAEIFLATVVATLLLLGYRELRRLDIPDGLRAAGAMLFGMTLGPLRVSPDASPDARAPLRPAVGG